MKKSLNDFFAANKFLLLIGFIDFFIIYFSNFNKAYEYFIDEFYYIACAKNPAAGYVDHPSLAPLLLTIIGSIFGYSLLVIRILPALASAATVFLAGILTKKIGGNLFAQVFSSITIMCFPVLAAMSGFYSMNAFEPLLALIAIILIVDIINNYNIKKWLYIGFVFGLGMNNKHTFVIIISFIFSSLIIAGKWKLLWNKYFFLGLLISFVMIIPNIIWQIQNNFPSLEFYRNITEHKNVYTPPLEFIANQLLLASPFTLPLWIGGIIFLFTKPELKQYRFIACLFIISYLFFMISGTSRGDRMAYAYPVVFSASAIWFEKMSSRKNLFFLKPLYIFLLIIGFAIAVPLFLPYFSYEQVLKYTTAIGFNTEMEVGKKPPLPQLLADRIGWKEKVDIVGKAYKSLTPEEQKRTIVAGNNYGKAGAIELYGKKYGIPFAASGHNNYYLWSKERLNGDILLELNSVDAYDGYKEVFGDVQKFNGVYTNKYVSEHENNLQVYICRYPKVSTRQLLENGRFYY